MLEMAHLDGNSDSFELDLVERESRFLTGSCLSEHYLRESIKCD